MHKSPLYYLMAKYRIKRGYSRGAIVYYKKLLDSHPDNISLQNTFARLLYTDKQYEKAIEYVDTLLEKQEDNTTYLLIKIRSLVKLYRYDEAIDMCNLFIGQYPNSYEALRIRADVYLKQEKLDEAYTDYENALDNCTIDSMKSYCYHSMGFIKKIKNDNGSDELFRKATELSEVKNVKELGIGILHFKRGWFEFARDAYIGQLSIDTKNAKLYFELGKTYAKLLDTNKAAEAYREFVRYDDLLLGEGHKLDEKLVVFDAYMGRNYACSPRAIYEEMLRNPKYKDYRFIWTFSGTSFRKHWKLYLNPRTSIVKYKSAEYFRAYSRAKYWVTNSRIAYVLKNHEDQVYVQCWHGTPLKRMGHSIVDTNKDSKKYDKKGLTDLYDHEASRLDYFLSPSRRASKYFIDAFGLDKIGREHTILEEGYPRNDFLANHSKKDVKIIKKRLGIPDNKKVLLYAPTWRDDQHDSNKGYTYKNEADFDKLRENIGKNWIILFRAHYFIANSFNFDKYKGFIYDVSNVDDINDLYVSSDALMTDYSSVFFDYANLNRPIIFFMYDLEHYMYNIRGFYIDLDELPGDIVKTEEEISYILSDTEAYSRKYSEKYDKFNRAFNYLDDGKASVRVVEKVIK